MLAAGPGSGRHPQQHAAVADSLCAHQQRLYRDGVYTCESALWSCCFGGQMNEHGASLISVQPVCKEAQYLWLISGMLGAYSAGTYCTAVS